MYACTDIGCCGSTITPHPTLKSSHDRDDNYEDNDENVDDGDEARHKLRRASYRSAHVRAYVSRLIFKERDFMTIFIRGLGEGGTGTRGNGQKLTTALELTSILRVSSRQFIGGDVHADFNVDKIYTWWEASREYRVHLRNISARSWSNPPDTEKPRGCSFKRQFRGARPFPLSPPSPRSAGETTRSGISVSDFYPALKACPEQSGETM